MARLYGDAGAAALAAAHVTVVGIGGVGSWAAEALARCGVGRLTLIDLDHIAESNINRQVHALEPELGKAKVGAMRERIAQIAPACQVHAIEEFVSAQNVEALIEPCDVLIDAIDQVAAKAALVAHCVRLHLPVVVCGAAGGRRDPLRLAREDLARAQGDPILAKLRYRLRRDYGFARQGQGRKLKFGVPAVYSDEVVQQPAAGLEAAAGLACAGYGSSVVVTAPMGFAAAACAIDGLVGRKA
ncbi:MAG TPA: tRNA threonylcarbamoyladenosine dehydratase [Burkholderiaceae bacterium]|nr:tRNA threonylcarbamoyladenosine dehydratase [Burkholderiaceae bacterium]